MLYPDAGASLRCALFALLLPGLPAGVSCAVPSAPAAPGEVPSLDPLLISATRLDGFAHGSIAPTELDLHWALPDVWSALGESPDAFVNMPGGRGGNPALSIRGGEWNFTKVIVDGIEVNNLNDSRGASYRMSGVLPLAVQSIAVVPGPQSSIYGSDALSGVVVIRTLPADLDDPASTTRATLQGDIAGNGDYGYAADVAGRTSGTFVHAAAGHRVEDGVVEGSTYDAWQFSGGGITRLGDAATLLVSALGSRTKRTTFPDDSGGPEYATLREVDHDATREAGASARIAAGRFTVLTYVYHLTEQFASPGVAPGLRDPGGVPANTADDALTRWSATATYEMPIGDTASLLAGVNWLDEQGRSDSTLDLGGFILPGHYERHMRTRAAFAEGRWEPVHGQLLYASVRRDAFDDLDGEWTGKVAWSTAIPRLSTVAAISWGRAFKKPSFFALSSPIVGNASLRPEHGDNVDLTLVTRLADDHVVLQTSVYHQRFRDLIDFSAGPPPQLVNLSRVTSDGVTTSIRVRPCEPLSMSAHLAWNDIHVADAGQSLLQRPKWRAGALVDWAFAASWLFTTDVAWTGVREDSSIPTGDRTLDAYVRVDMRVDWRATEHLRLGVAVENVTDTDYHDAIGFPGIGRRVRLDLRLDF